MELISATVLHDFGIYPKRIRKDKSSFVLQTDTGSFTIKKSLDSGARVCFAHSIKEHLASHGFINTDRFRQSSSGKPYVEHEGDIFVCTNTTTLRESNFDEPSDVLRAIESTAQMHRQASGVTITGKVFKRENALTQLRKDVAEVCAIKRRLGQSGGLSDFDVILLKNYNFYISQMKHTVAELEATQFETYLEQTLIQPQIIHNRLKEETLLTDGTELYITNFGAAELGYSLFDLISLIMRHLRESSNPSQLKVFDMIEVYNRHNPLRNEDIRIARALLHYPFRFVNLLRAYYSKKRTWTPNAILHKMQNITANRDTYYAQLE